MSTFCLFGKWKWQWVSVLALLINLQFWKKKDACEKLVIFSYSSRGKEVRGGFAPVVACKADFLGGHSGPTPPLPSHHCSLGFSEPTISLTPNPVFVKHKYEKPFSALFILSVAKACTLHAN